MPTRITPPLYHAQYREENLDLRSGRWTRDSASIKQGPETISALTDRVWHQCGISGKFGANP